MAEAPEQFDRSFAAAMASLSFDLPQSRAALDQLPHSPAVFALFGAEAHAEPYIGRTPNLRARLERLLLPSEKHPRRLQLAGRVRTIRYRLTGSEFESLLVQFNLLENFYGPKCLERMHLGAPSFVRFFGSNRYPRLAVTNRPSQKEAEWAYGPFVSRLAADRFVEETLKLFELRRCSEDLEPHPEHPGCVYSEMKMCLAPCFGGCSDERYAQESAAVERFLATRGDSRLVELKAARDEASAQLEFEVAASLHALVQKTEAVQSLAPELVQPLSQLRALVLQPSAEVDEVAIFLFAEGKLRGPAAFSTLGMRIQNENSGSSSLFAQPVALEPVLEAAASAAPEKAARGVLEARMDAVLSALAEGEADSAEQRQGHLALLRRWYYRPENKRLGEIFFAAPDGQWPIKAILRGVGRIAAKSMLIPASRPVVENQA